MNGGSAKVESAFSIDGIWQAERKKVGGGDIKRQHGLQWRKDAGMVSAGVQMRSGFSDDGDAGAPGYFSKCSLSTTVQRENPCIERAGLIKTIHLDRFGF